MNDLNYCITDRDHFVSWGWDATRLVEAMDVIRWSTIEGLHERHRAAPEKWGDVLWKHPQSWRCLSSTPESLHGFWHFVSLSEPAYTQVRTGSIVSTDLDTNMIRALAPGWHQIYLVTCCLDRRYRQLDMVLKLLSSFWRTLIELAEQGVMIREICTNGFTRDGRLMAQTAGLDYVCDHQVAGQIFAGEMQTLLAKPRASESVSELMRQLRSLYASPE